MKSNQLTKDEFAAYYMTYIQVVDDVELIFGLENSLNEFVQVMRPIPIEKQEYRYAKNKWTIKDIVQHLIDAERIFTYRALRISRNDKTELPGFEENDYVDNAFANKRTLENLAEEFILVRKATIALFKSFSDEQLLKIGIASNNPVSVRAIGFITIGHEKHHLNVIKERYL